VKRSFVKFFNIVFDSWHIICHFSTAAGKTAAFPPQNLSIENQNITQILAYKKHIKLYVDICQNIRYYMS
jgi:hypothetical protein